MAEIFERWQAVGLVIDQNHRDFLAGRYSLTEDVNAWFKAVDLFQTIQDERMTLHEPTAADLRQHRTWIASLIAEGERLLTESLSQVAGNSETLAQFKLSEMEAALELLYLWQREWHGPKMPATRCRELLAAVFNVQEPSA